MFRFITKIVNKLRPIHRLYVTYDSGGKYRPTIILLHGVAATSKTWDVLIKELDLNIYRVIAIDLLGFGKSPKPKNCDYSTNDHVRYIRKTIKKLNILKPYILVGHSMGSIISARYCRMYSWEVEQVFLLSPPIYFKDMSSHGVLSRKKTDLYMNAYQFMMDNKDFTITHSKRLRSIFRIEDGIDVREDTWDSFRLSLDNTIINQTAYDDIKNAELPVHVYYGSMDEFLVQESVNKLSVFDHVDITKLSAVNHAVGTKFAREVARRIEKTY